MYKQIQAFTETRSEVLHALMRAHPLGTLVTSSDALCADHIPFEIGPATEDAPHGVLRAHVARANPLWQQAGSEVLVVFQARSGYVTPSLYEGKATHHKEVPTWNYAAVHAHGVMRAIDDPGWLFGLLERMTDHHEAGRALPWSIHDAPRDFIDKLMHALVGIEIPIGRIQGKWKMSQNRTAGERGAILADVPAFEGLLTV